VSRKGGPPGSKNRGLSDEDKELWQQTARSLEPLKRGKARIHGAAPDGDDPKAAVFAPKVASHKGQGPTSQHGQPSAKASPATPPRKATAAIGAFDPRHARKLRRGHQEIEARIDLHGMRQSEAHAALSRFLISSAAQGRRWVLVITGKGAPQSRSGDTEQHRPFDEPQRGILKRNVPMWLAEPDLRPLVVSFTEAAIEHGGSGALYVHLRRQNRQKD